jgi:triosephosphate isomerase
MYKTPAEAGETSRLLRERMPAKCAVEVLVCAPFPDIPAVASKLADSDICWGAQNMFWEAEGAYTGEVSGPMLQALGCRYVIIGHSERRQHFGETDEVVRKKIEAALTLGLRPVFCLGEGLEVREAGHALDHCVRQLAAGLAGLPLQGAGSLVVAYEPIWAIGTGRAATAADAVQVIGVLRRELARLSGSELADKVRFLYGGSVKPENITELMQQEEIDGVLVGGASLSVDSFAAIISGADSVRKGQQS